MEKNLSKIILLICEIKTEDITDKNNEVKYDKIKEICCELLELFQKIYKEKNVDNYNNLINDLLMKYSYRNLISNKTLLNSIVKLSKYDGSTEIGFICQIDNPFQLSLSKSLLLITNRQFLGQNDLDKNGYLKYIIKVEFFYKKSDFILFEYKNRKLIIKDDKFLIFDLIGLNFEYFIYLNDFIKNDKTNSYIFDNIFKNDQNLLNKSNEINLILKNTIDECILEKEFQNEYTGKNERIFQVKIIFKNIIIDCSDMFSSCKNIIYIDLSHFNTEKVTNMSYMFYYCENLKKINLCFLNTENVTDMSYMFCGCKELINLDLSSFKTPKVEKMVSMFMFCKNLGTIHLKNFNTKKVRTMRSMFKFCKRLWKVDLTNFQTETVNDMNFMFEFSNPELYLDLSSFNFKNISSSNMIFMFGDHYSTNVKIKDDFKDKFNWKCNHFKYGLYFPHEKK